MTNRVIVVIKTLMKWLTSVGSLLLVRDLVPQLY